MRPLISQETNYSILAEMVQYVVLHIVDLRTTTYAEKAKQDDKPVNDYCWFK